MGLSLLSLVLPLCAWAYVFDGNLTVSGLSAGGFMAVQYHVAFSSEVRGAAVFAGGPYYCALANLDIAVTACESQAELIDTGALVDAARVYADGGQIDQLSGLKGDRVFLYSGTNDSVVHPNVVRKTAEFYMRLEANVTTQFALHSEHCQPTLDYGNTCSVLGSPYISRCNYDGAGAALAVLAGSPLKKRGTYVPSNLVEIKQSLFFPEGLLEVPGLAEKGYLYVPTSCRNGTECGIHIAFHGCNQNYDSVGLQYVEHAGYVEWAESNNLIVLFPQAAKSDIPYNPKGCFDWWGYTDPFNYAVQSALQMSTVRRMVEHIKSN